MHAVTTRGAALAHLGASPVPVVLVACGDDAEAELSTIRSLRVASRTRTTAILAVAHGAVDARSIFEAGADDLVRWTSTREGDAEELRFRVRSHLRVAETIAELADKERDAKAMLKLT